MLSSGSSEWRRTLEAAAVAAVLAPFGAAMASAAAGTESPPAGTAEPALAPAETPAPSDLAALLDDYRSLRPAPRGIPVRAWTGLVGHLELAFTGGTLFPLITRDGAVLGFLFDGTGRYYYRSEDPADRLVLAANCARETSAPIYYNHTVGDAFRRAVIFFAVPLFQDLLRTPPGDGPPITPGQVSDFDRIWKRIEMTYLEFDHLAAEARLNGGERQYVYGEFEGGRETAGYILDSVGEFTERLVLFRKVQGADIRFIRPLSQQEIRGGPRTHPASLQLKEARIEVSTEDNRSASIVSDLSLVATVDQVRVARLNLVNNRDPDHYDWASQANRLVVRRVSDAGGRALPFSHRYHQILVQLPAPLGRGEAQALRFETEGEILTGMHGRRYDNYFDLLSDAWFPQPSSWNSGSFTTTLKVKTRSPFRPIASGETVVFREQDGAYELETRSTAAATDIVVFAGKYRTSEEQVGGLTIRAHGYAAALQESLEKMPRVAGRLLRYYGDALGAYPFGDLDIIEVPVQQDFASGGFIVAFGIAPASIVLLTSEAFNPFQGAHGPGRSGAAYLSRGVNARLAHEIAHQWFPHQAMPASSRDVWLSESFAEYLSGLAMSASAPDERQAETFPQMFSEWQFQARACKSVGSLETASMLGGENAYRDYRCLVYNRGPLVLHMLRTLAGNEKFFAILRRFLERGREGPVTTDDFRIAVEEVLGTDMKWFFEQWYRQGGIPEIKVDHRVEPAANGTFVLTGKARQAQGPAFRKIHIPLVLEMEGGARELRLVFQERPVEEFRFDLEEKPRKVSVDPYRNNLAEYR